MFHHNQYQGSWVNPLATILALYLKMLPPTLCFILKFYLLLTIFQFLGKGNNIHVWFCFKESNLAWMAYCQKWALGPSNACWIEVGLRFIKVWWSKTFGVLFLCGDHPLIVSINRDGFLHSHCERLVLGICCCAWLRSCVVWSFLPLLEVTSTGSFWSWILKLENSSIRSRFVLFTM